MSKAKRVGRIFLSMLVNPIFMIVYIICTYFLTLLCEVGGKEIKVPIIIVSGVFIFGWLIWFIIRAIKEPKYIDNNQNDLYKWSKKKRIWSIIAVIILVVFTGDFSYRIYYSAVKYNGKLSWVLEDFFNSKEIELKHNNIYSNGFEGILTDISREINLPKELYVVNTINIEFSRNGIINSIEAFIYGENKDGDIESFLIDYNKNNSNKMKIYLNGYTGTTCKEDKKIKPFIKTLKSIPLQAQCGLDTNYVVSYSGIRSIGYNVDNLICINIKGHERFIDSAKSEVNGYIVVLNTVERKSDEAINYLLVDNIKNIEGIDYEWKNNVIKNNSEVEIAKSKLLDDGTVEYYFNKNIGYRLVVTDSAAGSRAYALNKTEDKGKTWDVLNDSPFKNELGCASEIKFLENNLGFISLSKGGGSYGELFRTEDGGKSFSKIIFPKVSVKLSDTENYNPFDFPSMPYYEDNKLFVIVGQGTDGDYNGGSKAVYESKDNGVSWEFINEINN